jgi:hypothetical protein
MPEPIEILQELHCNGISTLVSWFLGGQVRWAIGNDARNGWKFAGTSTDVRAAIVELAEKACTEFPGSSFAQWWAQHR